MSSKLFQGWTLSRTDPALTAVATLVGSIVGVGILGMPFAVAKVGFVPGMVMLALLALVNLALLLMYAELTLRTSEDHEIPGYGGLYLGHNSQLASLLLGIIGGYGTILAFIIAQGQILQTLFGGNSTLWSLIFFSIAGYIIYRGIEAVRILELIMVIGVSIIFFLIGLTAHPHINNANLAFSDVNNFIIPYGVLLFALSGTTAIPQIRQQLRHREKSFPLIILAACSIVFIMYAAFLWLTLGVTGAQTTEIATIGLGKAIGPVMLILGNTLAFFTISTSFITSGLSMRRVFQYDYNFPRFKAWLCALVIPLFLFLMGARNFIVVVGVVGGVILSVQNIIVLSAYKKSLKDGKRKPEFSLGKSNRIIWWIVWATFLLGAFLTVFDNL